VTRRFLAALLMAFWVALAVAQSPPPKPGAKDLCPVCGMLVSKYPNWVATIVYKDGHAHHFDGAKDMFKFWFEPARYAAGHSREAMAGLWVTDFYNLQKIDARKAWYVTGSDVVGPMGHELVPFVSKADAEEFVKEHKGVRVLGFEQVTREIPAQLDAGRF
jgi:copper chaperone NosL